MGFPGSCAGKESACHAGDPSSISRSGISPREELGCPLQDSWVSLVDQSIICLQWGVPGFSPCVVRIPWRQPTPVFLPTESPRTEKPGRLKSTEPQRVGHNWMTKHSTACCLVFTYLRFFQLSSCSWFLISLWLGKDAWYYSWYSWYYSVLHSS